MFKLVIEPEIASVGGGTPWVILPRPSTYGYYINATGRSGKSPREVGRSVIGISGVVILFGLIAKYKLVIVDKADVAIVSSVKTNYFHVSSLVEAKKGTCC
ncbi:hypothetical protein D3C77_557930 [compost metagenome]